VLGCLAISAEFGPVRRGKIQTLHRQRLTSDFRVFVFLPAAKRHGFFVVVARGALLDCWQRTRSTSSYRERLDRPGDFAAEAVGLLDRKGPADRLTRAPFTTLFFVAGRRLLARTSAAKDPSAGPVGRPCPTRPVVQFLEIRPEIRIQRAWGQGAGDSLSNDPTPVLHRISNFGHAPPGQTITVRRRRSADGSGHPTPYAKPAAVYVNQDSVVCCGENRDDSLTLPPARGARGAVSGRTADRRNRSCGSAEVAPSGFRDPADCRLETEKPCISRAKSSRGGGVRTHDLLVPNQLQGAFDDH
jgi:hypothetical protein